MIYRAAGIHLYMAELYTYWTFWENGLLRPSTITALGIVNDGSYYDISNEREELGVMGRVGLLVTEDDGLRIANTHYNHDPYTNEITGFIDLTGNLLRKQEILEDAILDERAREQGKIL